jgi:hypothetical protein
MLIGATKSNSGLSSRASSSKRGFRPLPKLGCAYTKEATFTSYNKCSMPCGGTGSSNVPVGSAETLIRLHCVTIRKPPHSIRASDVVRNAHHSLNK